MSSWNKVKRPFREALIDAFNRNTLALVLLYHCDRRLDRITSKSEGFDKNIDDVIADAVQSGWLENLAEGALAENTRHLGLSDTVSFILAGIEAEGKSYYETILPSERKTQPDWSGYTAPPIEPRTSGRLTGRSFKQFRNALLEAFNSSMLKSMVRIELDIELGLIVTPGTLREMVEGLIIWAEENGSVEDLLYAARSANFGNRKLAEVELFFQTDQSDGPEDVTSRSDTEQSRQLRETLFANFSYEELRVLCFDLDINFDGLNQDLGRSGIVRDLVKHMERSGRLRELAEIIAENRPLVIEEGRLSSFGLDSIPPEELPAEYPEVFAEAKLVLVGDGNVGKTSLVNRLVNGTFNRNESTTRGVAITHWHLELPCIDSQSARINIWDFGGQGNMHATHPYFFSQQALYLVALNIREDDRLNRAEYWIRLIRTYGGESPIIVVANKADQFSTLIDQRSLREKYPQISGFAQTSCKTNAGIPELRAKISESVCLLEDIDVRTFPSLVKVKKVLEDMTDPLSSRTEDTLTLDDYEVICKENGVEPERRIGYLRRLSDLGVVLYFGDDPRLEVNLVLNPFWVTDGVYTIINHEPLAKQNGRLRIDQVRRILPGNRYPTAKAMYIIDMMRKFELCFALNEQQTEYLLPDLLPPQRPELPLFDRNNSLELHYEYPVWHGATLTRLIVRLNRYLIEDYYWRNGALLQSSDQKNRALIIADETDRRLRIWVDGEQSSRRSFLNRIREELDVIHGIQRSRDIKELVIPPEGGEISYQFLVHLESENEKTHNIQVGNEVVKLNITETLDGVRSEEIPDSFRLKELIVERFSLDELDNLCFKLKISLEDVEGENIEDSKARNLIRLFERMDRMPELMAELRELRKDMPWK